MIETNRLKLIPVKVKHIEAFEEEENKLGKLLKVEVAPGWLVFPEIMSYSREYLEQNKDAENWWMYFFVLKDEQKLVGNGGFKGKPDKIGMVEIGYAIAPEYEGRGLATETAKNLTEFAFSYPQVSVVQAHTLAEENASNAILRKIGMRFVKELHDEEDGDIWQWQITREEYEKSNAKK